MKILTWNPILYSNILERNMMVVAAASNTCWGPFMSMLNTNDTGYIKIV